MSVTGAPWTSTAVEAAYRQLIPLPLPVMDTFAKNDLESARAIFNNPNMSLYIVTDECSGVWKRRAAQIRASAD